MAKSSLSQPQLHIWRQILASIVGAQSFCILGAAVAVGGVLFHQETFESAQRPHPDRPRPLWSAALITWLLSVFTLANAPGNLLSTLLYQRLGAVRVMLLAAPLAAIGALLVGLTPANTFPPLLAGRALIGLYFGVTEGPARAYVGEITSPHLRSVIGNVLNVVSPLYMLVAFGLGSVLSWRSIELALVLSSAAVQIIGVLQLHESPRWLIMHNRTSHEIELSLRFFMGPDVAVEHQVKQVQNSLHNNETSTDNDGLCLINAESKSVFGRLRELACHSQNRRPTLLLLAQFSCMIFSGGMCVSQFAPTIFGSIGNFTRLNSSGYSVPVSDHITDANTTLSAKVLLDDLVNNTDSAYLNSQLIPAANNDRPSATPYLISVYLSALSAVGLLVSGPLLERLGRVRTLQIFSVLSGAGCALLAVCFRWPALVSGLGSESSAVSPAIGPGVGLAQLWLPLVACAMLISGYMVGLVPVSFVLLVELLPNAVRSVAINVVLLYLSLAQWLLVHFYPASVDWLGAAGVMTFFVAINAVQFLLATVWLPETTGLTLEDIHRRHFQPEKNKSSSNSSNISNSSSSNDNPKVVVTPE